MTTTIIESSGVTALVQVDNNYYLNPVAGGAGVLLKANGAPVDTTQFYGWAAIGAELTADASGYEVVLKRGADEYCIWNVDIGGNYISQVVPLTGSSTQVLSAESDLHQDLNGDGWTGAPPAITIESSGLTKLDQLGDYYYLDTGAGGSGPTLKFNGAEVLASQYTPTWTLLGAELISGGYEVVWKLTGSDQYRIWTTDINGNCVTANNAGAFAGLSSEVESAEIVLQQDLNSDGAIGVPTITIESFGVTKLDQVGNNYYLDPVAGGAGVLLKANGAPVDTTQFYGWAAIGAERTADGYEVVLMRGADEYCIWNVDIGGNYISQVLPLTGSSAAIEAAEVILKQDLNGNGAIGVPSPPVVTITSPAETSNNPYQTITGTVVSGGTAVVAGQTVTLTDNGVTLGTAIVQADGSFSTNVTLPYQGANAIVATVADSYGNVGVSVPVVDTLNGAVVMKYNGTPVTPALDPGWVALGAEPTASGYEVVLKNSNFGTPVYALYDLDSGGNYVGGVSNPTNATVASWESSFHQDLNGDGMIGLAVIEPSSGAVTIESFGNTALVQVGSNYYLGAGGSGLELKYNGTPVTSSPFGGWVVIGAEQTSSGYQVALKVLGEDQYCIWNVDGNGNYLSNSTGTVSNWYLDGAGHYNSNITDAVSGSSVALETAELTFHQNLNSDGTIGIPSGSGSASSTIIESFGATTLVQQGSDYYLYTASPTVTITSPAVASNNPSQTITGTVVSGGTAVVDGQTVTLTDNGTILGTAVVQADGSFSAEVTLFSQGANSIVAVVTSGGVTGVSAAVVDTLDDIAPGLTIIDAPLPDNASAQAVSGRVALGGAAAVVGQTVTLTDNGAVLATTAVQPDGSFSTNVTLPNQSSNAIMVSVADGFGNTNNTYLATTGSGQIAITAHSATGTTNELDFTGGITDQNLWFLQSGNDLQIDILGTDTHVSVGGWFSSSDNQLQEINAAGLKIDNGVSQLVQAMASYSANNSGFDPTSPAVHMVPNDAGLQNALAATWHI